jgi:DNA-binding response OmpR family regulator
MMSERDVAGRRDFNPSIAELELQAIKPDLEKLVDGFLGESKQEFQLTPMEFDLLDNFRDRFPYPVSDKKLIQQIWGKKDAVVHDCKESLWAHIYRLRDKICRFQNGALVLYRINRFKQYLLSPRLEKGTWILPQNRADAVQTCKEEIRSFMKYCSQVQVKDSKTLVSRLTPSEFDILNLLGHSYPCFMKEDNLIQQLWGEKDAVMYDRKESLRVHIGRLREKIGQFEDGIFTIPDNRWQGLVGAYRLARREEG